MKNEKKPLCHDCLKEFETIAELYNVHIQSDAGPNYSAWLCTGCAKKRGADPKKLETAAAFVKRLNRTSGIKI